MVYSLIRKDRTKSKEIMKFVILTTKKRNEKNLSHSEVIRLKRRGTWQLTLVFLPGESQGQRRLVGYKFMGSHRVGHDLEQLTMDACIQG